MTKSDLTELAALNRQIAELSRQREERDQIIRALLPNVAWIKNNRECWFCGAGVIADPAQLICDHTPDCPYRRALELTSDRTE